MLTYLETLMTHPNITLHNHDGIWDKLWSRVSSLGFCNKSSRSSWTVQLEQQHSQTLLQRNPSSPFLCQRMSAADAIPLTKKVKQNRKRPRCWGVQPTLNGHLSTPPPFFCVNSILIFIFYTHTHYYTHGAFQNMWHWCIQHFVSGMNRKCDSSRQADRHVTKCSIPSFPKVPHHMLEIKWESVQRINKERITAPKWIN